MTLPAFAAERRAAAPGCGDAAAGRPALSIDIFLRVRHSAANPPHAAARSTEVTD